jgi:hypothetical protein
MSPEPPTSPANCPDTPESTVTVAGELKVTGLADVVVPHAVISKLPPSKTRAVGMLDMEDPRLESLLI